MSIANPDVMSPVRTSTRTPSSARTTLVSAQLVTALLLVAVGIWLIVLFQEGFNGGVILMGLGAVEIVLGALSLAAFAGIRAGRPAAWVRPLAIAGAAYNAAVIVFAATATLVVQYPGGAVVMLILFNDVIIGELAVMHFLARTAD